MPSLIVVLNHGTSIRYYYELDEYCLSMIFRTGKEGIPKDYYSLDCILFLLKNLNIPHPLYVRQAAVSTIVFWSQFQIFLRLRWTNQWIYFLIILKWIFYTGSKCARCTSSRQKRYSSVPKWRNIDVKQHWQECSTRNFTTKTNTMWVTFYFCLDNYICTGSMFDKWGVTSEYLDIYKMRFFSGKDRKFFSSWPILCSIVLKSTSPMGLKDSFCSN